MGKQGLYKRKRYGPKKQKRYGGSPEDHILFDVESMPLYENENPGTVTVEGFGMECWDYEEKYGKDRSSTVFVSRAKLPHVPAEKLLRRVDELKRVEGSSLGWGPEKERADLEEFFGTLG